MYQVKKFLPGLALVLSLGVVGYVGYWTYQRCNAAAQTFVWLLSVPTDKDGKALGPVNRAQFIDSLYQKQFVPALPVGAVAPPPGSPGVPVGPSAPPPKGK